jgi:hypothetical protein
MKGHWVAKSSPSDDGDARTWWNALAAVAGSTIWLAVAIVVLGLVVCLCCLGLKLLAGPDAPFAAA